MIGGQERFIDYKTIQKNESAREWGFCNPHGHWDEFQLIFTGPPAILDMVKKHTH